LTTIIEQIELLAILPCRGAPAAATRRYLGTIAESDFHHSYSRWTLPVLSRRRASTNNSLLGKIDQTSYALIGSSSIEEYDEKSD
jgi:hypothetical protein